MIINPNLAAQGSGDSLPANEILSKSISRPISGDPVPGPAAISAGAAAASIPDSKMSGLDAAQDSVSAALSFTQTQDAYLGEIAGALNRMSDLATLAQDPQRSDAGRAQDQGEFSNLAATVADAAGKDFNGVSLFSGNSLAVPIDADGAAVTLPGVDLSGAANVGALQANLNSTSDAHAALSKVQLSITQLSQDRAGIGASLSLLNSAADRLAVSKENLAAATSRVPDADVAAASVQFAKQSILEHSGSAMLAQANAMPQRALRLLP